MRFCKEHGIRFSGQKLGRPFEDTALLKAMKKQWREDERIRNAVEGKFGEGKRKYGIDRIMAKLKETGETVISLVFLVMNMERILRNEASSCCSAMSAWFLSVFGQGNDELIHGLTG
ncbi:MAG: transposase [Candidatus Sabulitectum sp.]|nr:transposase [Candidatus Sabulitectum sp.]